jgi:hypothetical protein
MKKIITQFFLINAFLIFYCTSTHAQNIAINSTGNAPNSSAMLDVQSTIKGMLIPRMTTTQRTAIASPATGLLVFDNTTGSFWFKSASKWVELIDSSNNTWIKNSSNNVYVNNGENVGIGTNNPDVRLQVSNGTDIANGTGGYLELGSPSNPNLAFDNNEIQARNNGIASNLYMQIGGGYVGIGTSEPEVKLQVSNGTDVSAISGGYLQLGSSSNTNLAFDNNEIQARNVSAVSPLYLQNNGGSLQIGSLSAPATDVHINNGELIQAKTGSANMMPLCYGHVSSGGTLLSSTSNVTITKSQNLGQYYINCTGITSSTVMIATSNNTHHDPARVTVGYTGTGQAEVTLENSTNENFEFSFIFYNQ